MRISINRNQINEIQQSRKRKVKQFGKARSNVRCVVLVELLSYDSKCKRNRISDRLYWFAPCARKGAAWLGRVRTIARVAVWHCYCYLSLLHNCYAIDRRLHCTRCTLSVYFRVSHVDDQPSNRHSFSEQFSGTQAHLAGQATRLAHLSR